MRNIIFITILELTTTVAWSGSARAAGLPVGNAADYRSVPKIGHVHKSCYHQVPEGAQLQLDHDVTLNGNIIDTLAPCAYASLPATHAPSTDNGWIVAGTGGALFQGAQYYNGTSWVSWPYIYQFYNSLASEFIVPPQPTTNDGQTIYLFPAIFSDSCILQPVLEWGSGFGSGWFMQNYYVCGDSVVMAGAESSVSVGDTIYGSINQPGLATTCNSSGQNCTYQVYWKDLSSGTSSSFSVSTPYVFDGSSLGTLEAYGVDQCSDFPGTSTTFFDGIARQYTTQVGNNFTISVPINLTQGVLSPLPVSACSYSVQSYYPSTTTLNLNY